MIDLVVYGEQKTKLYNVWKALRQRCNNPNNKKYLRYGGRGIKVCKEWNVFENFYRWSIANGYEGGLSIDRIDNDGNYEPINCRWATATEQQRNTSKNCIVTFNGKSLTAPEWAEITGIPVKTINTRKRMGWNDGKILTAPCNPNQKSVMAVKNGEVCAIFKNITQVENMFGISATHISACCNGKRKHAGTYEWRCAND